MIKFNCRIILKILIVLLLIAPKSTFAAMPDISSGQKYFDILSGCYVLKDNVTVIMDGRKMTADEAKVQVAAQRVWANGNVTLNQEGLVFKCDSIFVEGKESKVDVKGNVKFVRNSAINISSNYGRFSWASKVADFYGQVNVNLTSGANINLADNVKINGSNINGTYEHVQYNIVTNTIELLEKQVDKIPDFTFPEPGAVGIGSLF